VATSKTVLEMVQDILANLEDDSVDDIDETEESEMVTTILEQVFFDIVDEFDLPFEEAVFQLTPDGASTPTHMSLPSGIVRVDIVQYNKLNVASDPLNYTEIPYTSPKFFMELINARDSDDSSVDSITDSSGVTLLITNNANPRYWTSFDDEKLIFDSYDSSLESNLQQSKTWCMGEKRPVWVRSNNAKPDLPAHLEQYLFNETLSLAFVNYKQAANQKVEQHSRRSRRAALNNRARLDPLPFKTPDYGRKR